MEIGKHPIWKNISPLKKPVYLTRFFLARKIAKLYPNSLFIGITGSVGKTTTQEACLAVLSQKYKTLATKEGVDPIFGIPATLMSIRPGVKKVILEMGVEHPEEMDFYLSLVNPAVVIVTRISYAHSQFLGDEEKIFEEKGKLVKKLPKGGMAILNWDDVKVRKLAKETDAQVIFYGLDPDNCHIWAGNIRTEGGRTCFEINYGVERVEVTWPLVGKHFVYAALAAAALGLNCGLTLINIKKGLERITASPHRLQLLEGLNGWEVLDDTYNSSPAALVGALQLMNELPAKRRVVVLGEMRELGIYSEDLHRQVAREIFKNKIDHVLLGTGDTVFIADELFKLGFSEERVEANLSNSQLVSKIIRGLGIGDLVLIKGPRAGKLDEVVERVTKRR